MRPRLEGIPFPLRPAAFREALWRGQGRALLSVRALGDGPYRDALTEAFTRDIALDQQCEGSRAAWLMEIIEPLPAEARAHYEATALAALRACPADAKRDFKHLFGLAAWFWDAGSAEALAAVRECYTEERIRAIHPCGTTMLESNLSSAIAFEVLGPAGFDIDDWPWSEFRKGEESERLQHLAEIAREHALLRPLLEWIGTLPPKAKRSTEQRRQAPAATRAPLTLDAVMAAVDDRRGENDILPYGLLSKLPREIQLALCDRLLAERDPLAKARLLSAFTFEHQPLPRLDDEVLAMLDDGDERVRFRARAALKNVEDPRVRAAALRLLLEPGAERVADGIKLLVRNAAPGDLALVERALPAGETEREEQHDLDCAILDVVRKEQGEQDVAVRLRFWVAERTHCSICRMHALEELVQLRGLPRGLRREMRYDASDEIRKIVKRRAPR